MDMDVEKGVQDMNSGSGAQISVICDHQQCGFEAIT